MKKKRYQYFIPASVVAEVRIKQLRDPRTGRQLPSLESAYCRILQDAIRDYYESVNIRMDAACDLHRIAENDQTQFQNARLPLSPELHDGIKKAAFQIGARLYDFANILFLNGIQSFDYSQL